MSGLFIFISLAFSILVFSAAISDLLKLKIPNIIPILLLFLFVTCAVLIGWNLRWIFYNLLTATVVLIICFLLFNRGVFGGGDAKLISAISVWSGLDGLYEFILMMALSGGLLALIFLVFRKFQLPLKLRSIVWLNRLRTSKNQVPYGIAISAGSLTTFHQFPIFQYINNIIAIGSV